MTRVGSRFRRVEPRRRARAFALGPALRADELAARLPERARQQLPAGEGAKGKAQLRLGLDHDQRQPPRGTVTC